MTQPETVEEMEVVNVVSQRSIGCEIQLDQLAVDLCGAEYNPSNFPGVVYEKEEFEGTVLIFRSGEMVCTGVSSISGSKETLTNIINELKEMGVKVSDEPEIQIENVVYSGMLDSSGLNLNAIAIGLGLESVEYEPEQFPGLIYRPEDGNQTALLFASGKVVFAGMQADDDPAQIYNTVRSKIDDLGLL